MHLSNQNLHVSPLPSSALPDTVGMDSNAGNREREPGWVFFLVGSISSRGRVSQNGVVWIANGIKGI